MTEIADRFSNRGYSENRRNQTGADCAKHARRWEVQDPRVTKNHGKAMTSDDFNMPMRKYLKQVGVASRHAMEEVMQEVETSGKTYLFKMVIMS